MPPLDHPHSGPTGALGRPRSSPARADLSRATGPSWRGARLRLAARAVLSRATGLTWRRVRLRLPARAAVDGSGR